MRRDNGAYACFLHPSERALIEPAYYRLAPAARHRFAPVELPDSRHVRVQRLYPKTVLKPSVRTMLVPVPRTASVGGQPLRDAELLAWCGQVIRSVLADLAGA